MKAVILAGGLLVSVRKHRFAPSPCWKKVASLFVAHYENLFGSRHQRVCGVLRYIKELALLVQEVVGFNKVKQYWGLPLS
ncbi:MAG: hypothetical protein ACXV8I_01115 [Methylobacter sp.]